MTDKKIDAKPMTKATFTIIFMISICLSRHAHAQIIYTIPKTPNVITKITPIHSGTGFYVDHQFIITNEHVVRQCTEIRIRGAVKDAYASIHAIDKIHDLALLKTHRHPKQIATINSKNVSNTDIKTFVLGYPLEHAKSGIYRIEEGYITQSSVDKSSNNNRLFFTNAIDKGNSGGPLLDKNGQVVGVIVGKLDVYTKTATKKTLVETLHTAISTKVLERFLSSYNVLYRNAPTPPITDRKSLEKHASSFTVNIHCLQDKL